MDLLIVDEDDIEKDMDTLRQKLKEAYKKNPIVTTGEAIDDLQDEFYLGNLECLSEGVIQRNLVRIAPKFVTDTLREQAIKQASSFRQKQLFQSF